MKKGTVLFSGRWLGGMVMMMRKATRVFAVIAALIFLFVDCPSRAKDVYKWVDEKGTVHFSEEESSVPEKYRDQLEKKSLPEESKPPEGKVKVRKQDGKGAKEKLAGKEKKRINVNKIEGDVIESVKTILSLWKDGKYHAMLNNWGLPLTFDKSKIHSA
jgi:hypothetical protein